ncbi:hypothetical protein BDZ91DRAFT_526828 [Kalaharituber pfeilii]|nr:hypothetical protein BDZ91DRAFT_526828 [Kalaharituber pfeilii]
MNRNSRPHALDLYSTRQLRSRNSIGSFDCAQSANGTALSSFLLEASPEPAFIAPAAATQIVTNNHIRFLETSGDQNCINTGSANVPVTTAALRLLNQFLDYLLYSFLSTAKSTSLAALRPAVTAILKTKLGREAILGADEELFSYLGGPDGDELERQGNEAESGEWNLEQTWKKARVRCMVYSSLGDLEEDDEAIYSQSVQLGGHVGVQQNCGTNDVISPAVAIWLTAILEFVGEQTLLIAGQATITRYSALRAAARTAEETSGLSQSLPERPMVEELDTEKVALNLALGRLWRQWWKNVRGIGTSISIPPSENMSPSPLERPISTASSQSQNSYEQSEIGIQATSPSTMSDSVKRESLTAIAPEASPLPQANETIARNVPDLVEDKNLDEKGDDDDADAKNPLTPIWETSPKVDGDDASDITEFEETADIDNGPWLMRPSDDRRPRSLIMFPWTISPEFEFLSTPRVVKRPRSLPPLDTSFVDPIQVTEAETSVISVDTASETPVTLKHAEDTRSKIDSLMDRINMITSEQAELQKHLAAQNDDYSAGTGLPKTVVGAIQRGHAVTNADETDFETEMSDVDVEVEGDEDIGEVVQGEIGFAKTSNYIYPVAREHIQCTTVAPSGGCFRNRDKRKSSGNSPFSSVTWSRKSSNGSLTPVAEVGVAPDSRPQCSNSDCREIIDATIESSVEESSPIKIDKKSYMEVSTTTQLSFLPSSPRPPSHAKKPSYSSSVNCCESRKGSYSQPIPYNPPSTPSTMSEQSGKIRVRASSSDFGDHANLSRIVQRPIHTSDSKNSQGSQKLKTFMTWPADSSKRSELDDSSSMRSESFVRRMRTMDDKEKSFEELIQSGGTLVCTLTPDEIRDIESPELSPVLKRTDLVDYIRGMSSNGVEAPWPASKAKSPTTKLPTPRARDARVDDTSSSRDLALFLRTTGPPQGTVSCSGTASSQSTGHSKTAKLLGSGSSLKSATLHNQPSSPTLSVPAVMSLQKPEQPPNTQPNKKRLVARDASGSTGDSTSALADFFRTTLPPVNGEQRVEHRIPRSVAPFRTTMDSAQFDFVADELPKDTHDSPIDSKFATPNAAESYQSSMTSSTGLLKSPVKKNEDSSIQKMPHAKPSQSRVGPGRNQTHARDPCGIYSEEEFDMDDNLPFVIPKANKHEESLVDFLRNVPPPPSYNQTNEDKKVPKKSSAANLITRFSRVQSRKNSIASSPVEKLPYKPLIVACSDSFPSSPLAPSLPQWPQVDNNKLQLYASGGQNKPVGGDALHESSSNVSMSPRSQPPRSRAMLQPREAAVQRSSGTDSLAEFLRESAPPNMGPAPEWRSPTQDKEESSKSKLKNMALLRKGKRKEVAGVV